MNKISLYFKNTHSADASVEITSDNQVLLSMNKEYNGTQNFTLTKEEASYLASALRMVLGQEKVIERVK